MSVLLSKEFQQEIEKRTKAAQETLNFEKDYFYFIGDNKFHIYLPENVMEQKRGIELMSHISEGVEAEQRFLEFAIKYTHKNNNGVSLMALTMVETDMLETLYQFILLYPLSIWSQAMLDKELIKTLGLKIDSND